MGEPGLNYKIAGDGPPLLLIHGFGISFNIWKELIPLLTSYFTLVMVELPGIGKSPMPSPGEGYLCAAVEAVERVRRNLGFDIWDVLGYSTGSRIAEAYVQTHTGHVRKAVFLCPLQVQNYKLHLLRLFFWIDRFIPAFIPWILRGWRLKFLILLLGFSLHPDAHLDDWQTEITSAPVEVLKETARLIIPVGAKPFFVPIPFTLVWGDMDFIPSKPMKPRERDHFVHASHAAPILAPGKISEIVTHCLDKV
jgi:pimeloyl-ACP methyl ester carboxylesterase